MERNRRQKLYWEPIYDPGLDVVFAKGSWDFEHQAGPRRCKFEPEDGRDSSLIVEGIAFDEVDFEGDFPYRLIFKNCNFKKCDFAYTTFRRAKFTECSFSDCSFSLCTLFDCELRDCRFERIGYSGNETILENTLITNPIDFIRGGATNIKDLPKGTTAFIQKARFERTKSTLARSLMTTLSNEGSEQTYYDGVRVSTIQDCRARLFSAALLCRDSIFVSESHTNSQRFFRFLSGSFGCVGSAFDLIFLTAFGYINNWGSSVSRPLFIGAFVVLLFSLFYRHSEGLHFASAIVKSTEIFFLFGYTKHSTYGNFGPIQSAEFSNAVSGLLWYVVTIPTVVNKLTRVRG